METPRCLSVLHWNLLNVLDGGEFTSHDIRDRYSSFRGRGSISYGSVYVHMQRLCEAGLVQFRHEEDRNGKKRFFSLTEIGQSTLQAAPWIHHW